jgi:anti-anti-sigma factor
MGPSASPADGGFRQPTAAPPEWWNNAALGVRVEQQDATLLLRLTGEFDWTGVGRVEAALERFPRQAIRRVVFDLRALSFLVAAGLRTILRANERSRTEPFDVVVVRPRGLANRVFTLTRAGEQLTMVDNPTPRVPANSVRRDG